MKPKTRRLLWLSFTLVCFSMGIYLILRPLQDNLVFYYTPTEIKKKAVKSTDKVRVGGYVAIGTIKHPEPLTVKFILTDFQNTLEVSYRGTLPDLFREGQGCVAEGYIEPSGHFHALTVLAKHDEKYRPPSIQGGGFCRCSLK